ncbi:oligosaccharide flippase family protein [Allorhizobium sp. NPDC080224]|uniref:oligosaccharide flippase family protein n=1 Tax=Allorhizobium sp. NPDC080224 TaxID=3390547 RepID=UPI003D003605
MSSISEKRIFNGALWTVGTYALTVVLRFGSNVVLTRLVAPDVFGMVMIVTTLKIGMELLTDVGIGQSVVRNENADNVRFRYTAWTLQVLRSFLLCTLLLLASFPLGAFYDVPPGILQLGALTIMVLGSASTVHYYMQRHMQLKKMNIFDLVCDIASIVLVLGFAYLSPTVWSIMVASVVAALFRAATSYLLPGARNWFAWEGPYVREILSFGKWIFLSSMLVFLANSFDKLFLAQSVPLAVFGIYAIARTISELPATLVARVSFQLVFPLISANSGEVRATMRRQVGPMRLKLLLVVAVGLALTVVLSDIAVGIIYDARYGEAGWMLALLLIASWFAILCTVNEYTMMGLGKPAYGVAGNIVKLLALVSLTPVGIHYLGLPGAILAIIAGEILRYFPVLRGQFAEGLSFVRQDLLLHLVFFSALALFLLLRFEIGYGTPFEAVSLPAWSRL